MVGKKSTKTLQMEEGLERTDNGMKLTSFSEVTPINQKNYYTEYMKRDDQILPLRLQNEANRDRLIRNAKDKDRALARGTDAEDIEMGDDEVADPADEGDDPSKIIVIHFGSQNLRIGFASDALPKTIPACVAQNDKKTESDEEAPRPRRDRDDAPQPDQQFSDEWVKKYTKMSSDLKIDMRTNKRKVLPNSKELVVNYNRRTPPEEIPAHNDATSIEWTEVTTQPGRRADWFIGSEAQRVPDDSKPAYHLYWPMQHGTMNERDFKDSRHLINAFEHIIRSAAVKELGLQNKTSWKDYSVVFVIPDLYEKRYVEEMLSMFITVLQVSKVCFMQESLAGTFGAGYTVGCIVDIGAQKTSISCVEDGLVLEDSRVNLKYGGYDVTETFIKMMLYDYFPYREINLWRRYDFLLAEELKIQFCTMSQADISVQLYNFHVRDPHQPTRKYNFKTYDEVILAPMGFSDPSIFNNEDKLEGKRRLFQRSHNAYDVDVSDDPVSAAQHEILGIIKPSLNTKAFISNGEAVSTPMKEKPQPFNFRLDNETANGATPGTSAAGSPAPEGAGTPNPFGANGKAGSPAPFAFAAGGGESHAAGTPVPNGSAIESHQRTAEDIAAERDEVLPIYPLDQAIITSIRHASRSDDKKFRDLISNIMVMGGGAKTPALGSYLEGRLKKLRPQYADKILVGINPKEMDGASIAWKGGCVFGKLHTNDSWIGQMEYERLGSRVLYQKMPLYY